ncbi:MAG: response regulator transcription factor [Clostridiaceae bacterium]|jgi:DNA-binding response OmpR family regulator|nr:response regulator transcription factor [Clostridiaceae bacterium]
MDKILIVDDDREIASLISDALTDEGYECLLAFNGEGAFTLLKNNPDLSLILLDIMMPDIDGLEICREIRKTVSCPILFVTARNRTYDAMLGFEMGADDYISKPFVVEELVARVKAHLRREKRSLQRNNRITTIGNITIDPESYEVTVNGNSVELSMREFQLLHYLFVNAGKVLSKEQIFSTVWGTDFADIGTVAVNIKNLRDKIDKENRYIKTVWGVGYKFVKHQEIENEY